VSDRPWLTQKDICERFGICDETWRRLWRSGRAPAPDPVVSSTNRPKWGKQVIDDWDDERRGIVKHKARTFFASHRRSA
jgi:hypothetical protein